MFILSKPENRYSAFIGITKYRLLVDMEENAGTRD
jgi:hypothetical protein